MVHSVGLAVDPGDRLYSSSWRIASDSSTPGRIFRHDVGLPRSVLAEVGKKPFFMVFHHEPTAVVVSDFSGTAPSLNTPWTKVSGMAAGITFGGWINGSGILPEGTDNVYAVKPLGSSASAGSTLSEALAGDSWIGITITPDAGNSLDLNQAEFEVTLTRNNFNDAVHYTLFSSVDGFAESQAISTASFASRDDYSTQTITFVLPSTGFSGLTGPVEFRLYPHGAKYRQAVEMSSFLLR